MAPSLSKHAPDVMGLPDDNIVPLSITLEGSNFLANGHPFLTDVPVNIVATPSPFISSDKTKNLVGCFVGFDAFEQTSRHVIPVGKLRGIRFMSIFRFKVWWTTHWVGSSGRDVEHETQMMILEKNDAGRPYVLLLPLLEGPFRASLQHGVSDDDDNLHVCVESGSTRVCGSSFRSCVYMHVGDDPYILVKEAMKVTRVHLGTFRLLEEKNPPAIVDKFGWCTWDAFYLKVHPQGVWEGVKGLVEGGCPPGMVLIDDGWQSISHDDDPISQESMNRTAAGEQMPCRLIKFEENYKFRDYRNHEGLGAFVRDLKGEFRTVDHVYVWHALCGYWGGIRPNVPGMPESRVITPKLSEGLQMTMEDLAVEKIVNNGVGLVPPELAHKMYEGLHSHLASAGIDGVKVDVIHEVMKAKCLIQMSFVISLSWHVSSTGIHTTVLGFLVSCHIPVGPMELMNSCFARLKNKVPAALRDFNVHIWHLQLLEMLAEEFGGRVELAKAYYKALTASIRKHFKGNGVIASMEHCNDFMFLGTEAIALGRVGDDFWCTDPSGDPNGTFWLQGCHMVHCAYNSLWMGNFIHPDWDMFQSTHPCAEFHAASRAISGGPIYVSDSVGKHNFELLKSLVLPDGSVLRCQYFALPARDCLFEDPLHDGKTLLKIWNLNKYTGVVGLFNCQGGGWCPQTRRNKSASECSHSLACSASPKDIEWNNGKHPIPTKGVNVFAIYMFKEEKLKLLKSSEKMEISLEPFTYELLTVSPVTTLSTKFVQVAPIGLVKMLNSGGAIQSLEFDGDDENLVRIGVKGSGEMRVFASEKPMSCKIDGVGVEFSYIDQMVVVQVPWPNSSNLSIVEYSF